VPSIQTCKPACDSPDMSLTTRITRHLKTECLLTHTTYILHSLSQRRLAQIYLAFTTWVFSVDISQCGPSSSVDIATDYGLDGPGIESRWVRDFPSVQIGPGAHPAFSTMGIGSFPGVKCGRGVTLTTHLLTPRSCKSRAIPLPSSGPQPGL